MRHNSISRKPQVCLFLPLVKTQAPFLILVVCYESCVAAMGAAFFVRGFGCALFIWEADAKEKAYLIETLFDRINEATRWRKNCWTYMPTVRASGL